MNNSNKISMDTSAALAGAENPSASAATGRPAAKVRRWWLRLLVRPALLLAGGAIVIAALGIAQRWGLVSAGDGVGHTRALDSSDNVRYVCPMMCTPPQSEPGRCPVCAMELVPAPTGNSDIDSASIEIDPAARRVANINTVAVTRMPITREIRAVGELSFDESTLKTIAAYVDGRLDRLYADYTGVVVQRGDPLALVYSPQLYSGQVELLLARKACEESRTATIPRVIQSNRDLYANARQRLIELGMTKAQIELLERTGDADSRLQLCAPISGTVIEKLAVEGQYVKEGQAIYKLADLSTVWLMLELLPEDAAAIGTGQRVEAAVQSLPGQTFSGQVAFIHPTVNPKTRTVGVRVAIPNHDGRLRVGDYASAVLKVHVGGSGDQLVVPRSAVLMAGNNSVVYVQTDPGRFELRQVTLGPCGNDQAVVLSGLQNGEQVATRGNFLIDSQMQLAGRPSLIDPTKGKMGSAGNGTPVPVPPAKQVTELPKEVVR